LIGTCSLITNAGERVAQSLLSNNGRCPMKALIYQGHGKKALLDHPKPVITAPGDAIVRVTKTTICGTDLHILKVIIEA
jgi:hypothetical protein